MLGLPIRNHDMLRRLMLLALGLTILPFAILTIFSNPAYDDYCFAVRSMRLGFIEAQKSAFNTRFGRYFSTALLSWDLNFSGYHVFAFLFILLTLAAIYFLVAPLLDSSANRLARLPGVTPALRVKPTFFLKATPFSKQPARFQKCPRPF